MGKCLHGNFKVLLVVTRASVVGTCAPSSEATFAVGLSSYGCGEGVTLRFDYQDRRFRARTVVGSRLLRNRKLVLTIGGVTQVQ